MAQPNSGLSDPSEKLCGMSSRSSADAAGNSVFTAVTGSGMLALWDPVSFAHVVDYDGWEVELLEDEPVGEHIQTGKLVPLNILADGRFGVLVRVDATGAAELTARERKYLQESSEPYLFRSTGTAKVSGIESVGAFDDTEASVADMVPTEIDLPAGDYAVTVHLLDWEAEPGAMDDEGDATPSALPDFVVLIEPAAGHSFRTAIETFDDLD
ncbi:hypothetical protein ACFVUS_20845 [Nocardia sp. NPDC058058]|uniref:hypothetical protein n=2 Tax=Nocardia TaxID=1817 RepID=UPI0036DED102